jgi:hypothetical protein
MPCRAILRAESGIASWKFAKEGGWDASRDLQAIGASKKYIEKPSDKRAQSRRASAATVIDVVDICVYCRGMDVEVRG